MLYGYITYQESGYWVAESNTLRGCVGQGDTEQAALMALEENETVWLETAKEYDIDIPERK